MRGKIRMPTAAEDRRINAGIAADPDTWEVTKADIDTAAPAAEKLPLAVYTELTKPRRRGPGKRPAKVLVSVRVEADVLARLRASGAGWQIRAAEALRKLAAG